MNDASATGRPFRFYDTRQKYLTFVTTCNEKSKVAERAARELPGLSPRPPALRLFDAGVGDGTVLAHLLRAAHAQYPTVPFYVVGKEISLEDMRLVLDKLPDRFIEHPQLVVVLTNLQYPESPWLWPNTAEKQKRMHFEYVELDGTSSYSYGDQLRALDDFLVDKWQVAPSEKTGNPLYVHPTAMVISRADQHFALDQVIPKPADQRAEFDLVLAAQPWRSRMTADFKASKILAPLSKALRSGGVLLGVQSRGDDPGLEIVRRIWPDEDPFPVDRYDLIAALHTALAADARNFDLMALPDSESWMRYEMHTLPTEIGTSIGTSTLFAAWNAAIYVGQIEDDRVESVTAEGRYLDATGDVLQQYGGLWFNNETFLVRRH